MLLLQMAEASAHANSNKRKQLVVLIHLVKKPYTLAVTHSACTLSHSSNQRHENLRSHKFSADIGPHPNTPWSNSHLHNPF
jgi:hypothetical protein